MSSLTQRIASSALGLASDTFRSTEGLALGHGKHALHPASQQRSEAQHVMQDYQCFLFRSGVYQHIGDAALAEWADDGLPGLDFESGLNPMREERGEDGERVTADDFTAEDMATYTWAKYREDDSGTWAAERERVRRESEWVDEWEGCVAVRRTKLLEGHFLSREGQNALRDVRREGLQQRDTSTQHSETEQQGALRHEEAFGRHGTWNQQTALDQQASHDTAEQYAAAFTQQAMNQHTATIRRYRASLQHQQGSRHSTKGIPFEAHLLSQPEQSAPFRDLSLPDLTCPFRTCHHVLSSQHFGIKSWPAEDRSRGDTISLVLADVTEAQTELMCVHDGCINVFDNAQQWRSHVLALHHDMLPREENEKIEVYDVGTRCEIPAM
ncbi:hypothetical protein ANO11243_094880 [Dothideomycetidae sp. 11243]|nr:hypothetical protein ANO11243_094880 [fungal sp. No.11243]